MAVSAPARPAHARTPIRVVDRGGRVWSHHNPAELYRWVSRRNELLRTIDAVPIPDRAPRATAGQGGSHLDKKSPIAI
jgi:hypothetical protein